MGQDHASRIQPILPSEWDDEILDALGAFPGSRDFVLKQWQENTGDHRGRNTMGVYARYPALAKAFLTFNCHVATNSSISTRDKELLILRTSWLKKGEYEFIQHIILGRRAGISDEEIRRIQDGPNSPGWSAEDANLIQVADDLHRDGAISDATWGYLSERYENKQIMDMVFLVGCYQIAGMMNRSFKMEMDPGVEPLDSETKARMMQN